MLKKWISIVLLSFAVCAMAKTLTFAIPITEILSNKPGINSQTAFAPLIQTLEKKTGWKINTILYNSYYDAEKLLLNNKTDFIYTKVFPYIAAKKCNPMVKPVTSVLEWSSNSKKLASSYSALIIADKSETNINSIQALKNTDFGFVNYFSASGYIYTVQFLKQHGINYRHFFASTELFGNHSHLLDAIKNGEVSAGSVWEGIFHTHSQKPFKVLARINDIPTPLIASSATMNPAQIKRLQSAFLALPPAVYVNLPFKGMVKPITSRYDAALPLASELGIYCSNNGNNA